MAVLPLGCLHIRIGGLSLHTVSVSDSVVVRTVRHHGTLAHDPPPGFLLGAAMAGGGEHVNLLLRSANEDRPFGLARSRQPGSCARASFVHAVPAVNSTNWDPREAANLQTPGKRGCQSASSAPR